LEPFGSLEKCCNPDNPFLDFSSLNQSGIKIEHKSYAKNVSADIIALAIFHVIRTNQRDQSIHSMEVCKKSGSPA
jgi:hypothetical protein